MATEEQLQGSQALALMTPPLGTDCVMNVVTELVSCGVDGVKNRKNGCWF